MIDSQLEAITEAVFALLNADDWHESQRIVERQRDLLLTDEADQVFADLLSEYEEDSEALDILQQHRDLLARCRAEGIEAAFAQLRPIGAPDIPLDLLARLQAVQSDEELYHLLMEHPELLPILQEHVAKRADEEAATDENAPSPQFVQELANKFNVFISKESWPESKAYLQEHPELLTDEAAQVIEQLIEQAQQFADEETSRLLTQHRDLLRDVRQKGLDKAFADLMTYLLSDEGKSDTLNLIQALLDCDDRLAVMALVVLHPSLLSDNMDAILQRGIADAHGHRHRKRNNHGPTNRNPPPHPARLAQNGGRRRPEHQ